MIYTIVAIGYLIDIWFIIHDDRYHDALSIVLKTSASLTFVILSIYLASEVGFSIEAKLIMLALIADLLGDFVLIIRNVDKKHKDLIFMVGMILFLIGHFFLIVTLYLHNPNVLSKSLIITSVLFVFPGIPFIKSIKANKTIKIAGALYLYVIVFVLIYCFSAYSFAKSAFIDAFLFGYFLFCVSDIILTIVKFNKDAHKALQVIYRLSYFISQVLIALSIMYL